MLVILTTHPIQYQIPLWQALAADGRVRFEVWYLTEHGVAVSPDLEFGISFAWNLDFLSGYPHRFLESLPHATPSSFWKCRVRRGFGDVLRANRVSALWIQGWQVGGYWQAVWEAKKLGIEVWLRGESNDMAPTQLWKRAIRRKLLSELFRRVDRFLYIGQSNRKLYENFGVTADKLFPVLYGVDNERFARQAKDLRGARTALRSYWCIPEDSFCVLFCGKFITKKRPLDLVAAACRLMALGHLRVHLLFVGSGELGDELRRQCSVAYDAESRVGHQTAIDRNPKLPAASFAGFLNQIEISKGYVAADCLVLPSDHRETWGLVVNEAMASGLPAIVSDQVGCGPDLVDSGVTGEVFPTGDVEALANAILRVSHFPGNEFTTTLVRRRIARNSIQSAVDTIVRIAS